MINSTSNQKNNPLQGIAHVYGDDIDTDRIIPGKYTKTLDLTQLAAHVLEDLDPEFRHKVKAGDILAAGENFGCGSSREQAPLALKHAGISLVIAKSFARIFFRNAINIGLPPLEIPDHAIPDGATLRADVINGIIIDEDAGKTYQAIPLPAVMMAILQEGGLVNYLKKHDSYS